MLRSRGPGPATTRNCITRPVGLRIRDLEIASGIAAAEWFVGTEVQQHDFRSDRHVREIDDDVGALAGRHQQIWSSRPGAGRKPPSAPICQNGRPFRESFRIRNRELQPLRKRKR